MRAYYLSAIIVCLFFFGLETIIYFFLDPNASLSVYKEVYYELLNGLRYYLTGILMACFFSIAKNNMKRRGILLGLIASTIFLPRGFYDGVHIASNLIKGQTIDMPLAFYLIMPILPITFSLLAYKYKNLDLAVTFLFMSVVYLASFGYAATIYSFRTS